MTDEVADAAPSTGPCPRWRASPELRAALLERQRALAEAGGIIVAGRDIGTVVLPDADLKLFLDASVEERARRRTEERGLDPDSDEAEDVLDQLRGPGRHRHGARIAPLRAADDAVHVVTDGNTFDETVEIVAAEIALVMLSPLRRRTRPKPKPSRMAAAAAAAGAALGAPPEPEPDVQPAPEPQPEPEPRPEPVAVAEPVGRRGRRADEAPEEAYAQAGRRCRSGGGGRT